MKTIDLPKMSTVKPPKTPQIMAEDSNCINLFAIDTVNYVFAR